MPPCSWYLYWGSCWESVIGAWRMMKCSWLCRGRTHICASWASHLAGVINGRCNIGSRSSRKCVEPGLVNIQEPQGRESESRVISQGWRTAGLILDQQVSHGLHTLVWFRVTARDWFSAGSQCGGRGVEDTATEHLSNGKSRPSSNPSRAQGKLSNGTGMTEV